MGAELPTEVFLSHSSRNGKMADRVAAMLRKHGVPVWYSKTNIVGAKQWHDEIGAALGRCDWFLLLLSKSSVKSKWVKRELVYALRQDHYEDRIVPRRYTGCNPDDLSWTLESFQHVDFSRAFDDGASDLLRMWGIGYVPEPHPATKRPKKRRAPKKKKP